MTIVLDFKIKQIIERRFSDTYIYSIITSSIK